MAVRTTVEPLERHKVKLHVEIPASDFDTAIDAAFRKLAQEVRMPGFRKGKVPRRVLEARLGKEALREEALKESLPKYFLEALKAEEIDAVSEPEIDNLSADEGADVSFDAVVEVRPKVELGDWKSIQVEVPSPEPSTEEIDRQLERIQDQFAETEPVGRPAQDGDFVTIDIRGYVHSDEVPGTVATDLMYKVGQAGIVPKLDEELRGKRAGDILKFNDVLPEAFGERAGEEVTFSVLVKEVSARKLPPVTDEWVQDVSEFETVDELRADLAIRVGEIKRFEVAVAARNKVLEALARRVTDDPPDALVNHEMEHLLSNLITRLRQQKIGLSDYLEATGEDQETFVARMKSGAADEVRADLALRAIASSEGLEATEEEMMAEVARIAQRTEQEVDAVAKSLEQRGAWDELRSDIVKRSALELAVRNVEVTTEDGATLDIDALLAPEPDQPDEVAADEAPTDSVEADTEDQADEPSSDAPVSDPEPVTQPDTEETEDTEETAQEDPVA